MFKQLKETMSKELKKKKKPHQKRKDNKRHELQGKK